MRNRFGVCGITYVARPEQGTIDATVDLEAAHSPARVLVRFRHPQKKRIKAVEVNGAKHRKIDAKKGDVDITGCRGKVWVRAMF